MTDLSSPITGPLPAPMFDSGAQPVASPTTEPNPAPIFDTGPNPDPLRPRTGAIRPEPVKSEAEPVEAEVEPVEAEVEPVESEVESEPEFESKSEPEPEPEPEFESEPGAIAPDAPEPPASGPQAQAFSESENVDTDAFLRAVTGHQPVVVPAAAPVQPAVVPSSYQFVKRWKFVLIVAGVWLLAAAAGAGCYFWWYTALDKTVPVLGILLFVVACMVGSLLVSLVPERPQLGALALALMAAPLAATAAAAVLHGAYFFEWISRPVIG